MFSVLRGLAIKQKSNLASVCLVILLVVALTFSFLVKFSSDVEAQQQNLEIINLAQSPVNGDWQTKAFGTNYTLWKFRSPAAYPGNRYLRENHYIDPGPPEVLKCDNVYQSYGNKPSYEDNLQKYAFSGISARDCAGNTTTSGFTWPLNKETVRTQKPFLVVGNEAQNSSGFINKEIVLKLWILQDKDIEDLMLNIEDFCDDTNWDLGSLNGKTVLYVKGQSGEQRIKDEDSCSDDAGHLPIKKSIVGEDFGSARYVQLQSGGVEEELYKQYRLIIRIEDTHVNNNTYVNQFRLNVQQPAFSYLGAGQTARNGSGEYTTDSALSISNRLPGGEQDESGIGTYKRLEILWQTTIYLASDPSRGCSGYEKQPIGLYDSDYPTSFYNDNDDYESKLKPMVQVWSVDRNDFLENLSVDFRRERRKDIEFDGEDQAGINVSNNQWEYEERSFERDRIYKLEIYNIDERSWIQIGLPYDQLNALSKCVYKPLVKAYYSDVSIGGRFGLGTHYNACEGQGNRAIPIEASLYTHDHRGNVADSSSAQYAVRVNDEIIGFYSNYDPITRILQKDNPLTFANTGNAARGGHFDDDGRCIPNYWRGADSLRPIRKDRINMAEKRNSDTICVFKDVEQNGRYLYQPVSGLLTLENGCDQPPIALKLRSTIYVDGDLLIKSDIINSTSLTQWNAFNEIGYIYLIVKGDILIDPKVRQIDAILVAVPDEAKVDKLGRIYTCYVEDLFDSDSINIHSFEEILAKTEAELDKQNRKYNNQCQNQLVINGALIGREVHLGRTYNPAYRFNHAAETINLLPEYFVGTPQLPEFNEWFYKSDSVIVLPTNF